VQDIVFRGLNAPLRLTAADPLLPVLTKVAIGWPFASETSDVPPFYSVTGEPGEPLFWCDCHIDDRPRRRFDPVNSVCDVVSALALALPAERPELICLHAAGVTFGDRLVIFPNIQKAGKSTLSAALARAGHPVFSDDVIPIFFDEGQRGYGLAMGIAPRLRLPLPERAGQGFHDWVAQVSGPANRQYRYLNLSNQPPHGTSLPLGAFVILDRKDEPVRAQLDPVAPDQAMDALLFQNFTRDRHSGDILKVMASLLTDLPVYRLTFCDLDDAVGALELGLSSLTTVEGRTAPDTRLIFRMAEDLPQSSVTVTLDADVCQGRGSLAVPIGGTMYLADAGGRAIHRMDPLAAAIWDLIEDPMPARLVVDILVDAFPQTPPDQVSGDVLALLNRLHASGLITVEA
jgi:hypothetical protein